MNAIAAEQLYEYDLQVTGMVEYGASLQPILAGATPPPPGGLRIDDGRRNVRYPRRS